MRGLRFMQITFKKRLNPSPCPSPPASVSPASHPSAAPATSGSSPGNPTPKSPPSPNAPPRPASSHRSAYTNQASASPLDRSHNPPPHNCAPSPAPENAYPKAANSNPPQPKRPPRQTATGSQSHSLPPRVQSACRRWNGRTASLASPPHALHPPLRSPPD